MPKYDNTNRIAIFVNDKKGNEARPDLTGKVNVEGEEYKVALWRKGEGSERYWSGQIQLEEGKESSPQPAPQHNEDVPF